MASSAKRRAAAVVADQRRQDDEEDDDMEEEMEDDDEDSPDDIEDDESEEDEEVNEEVNVDFEAHTISDGDHDGIKKLLKQVEAHPVLWDTSEIGYNDRQLKDEAWNAICRSLHLNWDGLPEKEQAILECGIRNKWRTVLCRFLRGLAREQRSTAAQSKRKQYIYKKEMMFLTTSGEILQTNPDDLEFPEEEELQNGGGAVKGSAPGRKGSKRSAKGKKSSVVIVPPRPPRMRKRRVVRSRAYISEQVDAGLLTLLQTKATEDGLNNYGRVVAAQVRRLPLHRRADFMAFALSSVEFFLPPYNPPALDTLVSSLREVCTEQPGSSQSDDS